MSKNNLVKETITETQRAEFAKSLRQLREIYGLTVEELSEYTEIPNQTLSRYERGENEPSIVHAYKIAKYFGVTVEEMICGEWDIIKQKPFGR